MKPNHYETVFILTPVLSEAQMKDTVEKFKQVLASLGAEVYHHEDWGLKKLAYPIQHKSTGFYTLFEFKAMPEVIKTFETELRRDERVMRFLTVKLDKHAIEYNEKRRKGLFNKKIETITAELETSTET
ncbi:MAG: 30S ribosomal protein S6 [Bernardetiaceae bacterium]|nr:30S ribosomal protein S6 [Bernardetiaceae bacterium]